MPKLTDEEIEAIDKALTKTWSMNRMESDRYQAKIRNNTYRWLTELVAEVKELRAKAADPTPPVQPAIKQGDKVWHIDHHEAIGEVWDHPQVKARFKGQPPRYYRLDKLEVITDDPST